MEPVDILDGRDAAEHQRRVELLGQRKLDEDAVDRVVGIELGEQLLEMARIDVGREAVVEAGDAHLLGGFVLARNVDVRSGILADEHRGQSDVPELLHVMRNLAPDAGRERASLHQCRRHGGLR